MGESETEAGAAGSERVEPAAGIRAAIERDGPITFAAFMELALYGPGGFYERPPVGPEGHFVTSPHVHPVFGTLLARGLREAWVTLGRPEPFVVVEAGAGDGTLARQLLAELADLRVAYVALERSRGALEALRRLADDGLPLRVASSVDELETIDGGVLVANELLDNLPFRRVRGSAAGPVEVSVGGRPDGGFLEVEAGCEPELAAAAGPLEPGEEAVVPVEAFAFVDRLASLLVRGVAVLIDYEADPATGPFAVHGYREHRVVGDVLADPGSADITAGVDLSSLAERAERLGLSAIGPVSQTSALAALGWGAWMRGELARQGELLDARRGVEAVTLWSDRQRASLLVDPAGLGRLRWLGLVSPDADPPPWLRSAAAPRPRRTEEPGNEGQPDLTGE